MLHSSSSTAESVRLSKVRHSLPQQNSIPRNQNCGRSYPRNNSETSSKQFSRSISDSASTTSTKSPKTSLRKHLVRRSTIRRKTRRLDRGVAFDSCSSCSRVVINVSGSNFEVSPSCLERFPETLLGNPLHRNKYFVTSESVYFFDRHRLAFEGILQYYQTFGRVMCPPNVPEEVFRDELQFFKIDCQIVREAQNVNKFIKNTTTFDETSLKQQLWRFLTGPLTSTPARVFSLVSLCMTLAAIVLVCISDADNTDISELKTRLFPLEVSCFVWFTMEYVARLVSTPDKLLFLKSWIDTVDLFTLLVFYLSLALSSTQATSTGVLRIFRLANVFRVFRLTRFSNGFRLLVYTVYKSRTDLHLLGAFFAFFILISGSVVYFAESDPRGAFKGGIFDGIWFAVVSCTTVGYGDIVPRTNLGKFVASLVISFGAMFILLPVLKLVNTFSDALQATRELMTVETKSAKRFT